MIYLFYGTNEVKARAKWRGVAEAFAKKYPSGAIFRFDTEHFDAGQFEELASGADLFGGKRLVLGDRLLENELAAEFVTKNFKLLIEAPAVFCLLERELEGKLAAKIRNAGGKLEEFAAATATGKLGFNIFALSDALAARDRQKLWLSYHEAERAGLSGEEIFWKLVWPVKNLLLVQNSPGAPRSLKPFVLDRARRSLKNFKPGELERLSAELVALWHDARRGLVDFDTGLEKLVLSV